MIDKRAQATLIAALLLVVGFAAWPTYAAEPALNNARLIGRFLDAGDQAVFEWPGSAIEFAFEGSWLDVVLDDRGKNSLVLDVDGKLSRIDLKKGSNTYRLVATQGADRHSVRLVRRTEAFFGTTTLKDVRTDGTLLQPEPKKRSLLVIGDSISAGYGIEGMDAKCKFSADTENQYLTYAAIAARRYDADVITLAASGKGLVRNFRGAKGRTMADLYDRILPSRRDRETLPKTDVIIVHLGTNDFSGGARPANFAASYAELLAKLRANAPDAMIYAGFGPLLTGEDFAAADKAVGDVVKQRRDAGDSKTAMIRFTEPPGASLRGCDWHPNEAGQQRMANQLEDRIEADLGWAHTQ
ncbi:SGNH/GDSL hydrolase family protein [Mesorhizobium captivum]|uniref:SGNH/GDSL hydrolase family protein n=1 Tax=Mesorhizobium captivum TaxID=3072319 RepID=UPI002A23D300|nr:GDSL-type esterase/lipase family protein [Mesorhizobium sp. VK23E]MDX8513256.1 GDSL-type esterase/lipase family protein [Mesorhizobium sp. VK23E]